MTRLLHVFSLALASALLIAPAIGRGDEPAPAASPSAEPTGTLTIHAVQGTPGAPAIGACDADVEFRHNGVAIAQRTVTLDDAGAATIDNVPIAAGVVPVVKIRHADAFYLQSGSPMDGANPSQTVTVTCYEVTSQEPAWRILVRHVMLVGDPHGLRVTEVLQIHSDGDRTWLGIPHSAGLPITTSFSLPAGAADVQLLQGFNGWEDTTRVNDALYNHLPLMPGDTEMTFSYAIHSHQAPTPLLFRAPVLTEQLMLIVPDTLAVSDLVNVAPGGGTRIADTDVHFYAAQDVLPGGGAGLTVTSTQAMRAESNPYASAGAAPVSPDAHTSTIKWIAAGGGGAILLAAGALLILRRPGASASRS